MLWAFNILKSILWKTLLDTASSFTIKDIKELKEILFLILLPLYHYLPPPQDLGHFACRYLTFDSLYYFLLYS